MVIRFEHPEAFFGFIPLILFFAYSTWKFRKSPSPGWWRRTLVGAFAFSLCLVGLAQPQMGERVSTPQRVSANLYLVVDISRSMLASDVQPTRLDFAVEFSRQLISLLKDVRVAIFPFALNGYLSLPLTTDLNAVSDSLSTLHPTLITAQGTDLGETLKGLFQRIAKSEEAAQKRQTDWGGARVLLLSDGESHVPLTNGPLEMFKKHAIPIFVVGVGTTTGARVPFDMGAAGTSPNTISKLDPKTLHHIAEATNGDYFAADLSQASRVAYRIQQSMAMGKLQSSFKIQREFFPWCFFFAFLFFLTELSFGRWQYVLRTAFFASAILGLARPSELQAADEKDPAVSSVQTYNLGVDEMKRGNFRKAAESFEEASIVAEDAIVKKQSLYNLGNILVKEGELSTALQVYQQAKDIQVNDAQKAQEIDRRITDNMQLAAMKEKQMQQQQGQSKKKSDDGDGSGQQPTGPQKFQKQAFDEGQKKKIWDMVSNEEKQTQQRLREQANRQGNRQRTEKPW